MLIGGFFDAHHVSWTSDERRTFDAMLEEQDVDIMAWAVGTQPVPERFQGRMTEALKRLDYIRIAR
jgi:antitoxin CptB